MATNLSEYESTINRVFHQDDKEYPNIPFTLNGMELKETDATTIIRKLIEVSHKGFYTRKDFFEIINNPLIQRGRGIDGKAIDTFVTAILDTNVYRQRENHDDWDYIKKRVLLAKVTNINNVDDNVVTLSGDDYIPYTSIALDDETIIKFVKIIDDLNDWLSFYSSLTNVDDNVLDNIRKEFDKWLSLPNSDGVESNYLYKGIIKTLDTWKEYKVSDGNIPVSVLMYALLEGSKKNKVSHGDILAGVVSFVNFSTSSVLSAPYIYLLGAGSSQLPSKQVISELYVLNDKSSEVERNIFFLEYLNAEKHFTISYIGRDLKTDEEFFPSVYVQELKDKGVEVKDDTVPLDETRDWNKVFTRRSTKDKLYYQGLLKGDENPDNVDDEGNDKEHIYDTFTVTTIANFLTEPLMWQAERQFLKDDNNDEEMIDEYEPFEINTLSTFGLYKKIICYCLKNNSQLEDRDEIVEMFEEELDLNNELPGLSEAADKEEIAQMVDEAMKFIDDLHKLQADEEDIIRLDDLVIDDWTIVDNEECYRAIKDDVRYYTRVRVKPSKKPKDYLFAYVFSLMDIAMSDDEEKEYEITIEGNFKYTITKQGALDVLRDICETINKIEETKCMPIAEQRKAGSPSDLLYKIKQDGAEWCYFDHKEIFDETQLGYEDEPFDYLELSGEFQARFIKYIKKQETEGEDSNG